jgi:hypothetical protein
MPVWSTNLHKRKEYLSLTPGSGRNLHFLKESVNNRLGEEFASWVGSSVESNFDLFRQKKEEGVAVMADRQPAGEAFHSRFVDPDLSVAGDPVYESGREHRCLSYRHENGGTPGSAVGRY